MVESGLVKIPKKSLFKVEEVCDLIDVKPYVLRFWESEFAEIRPMISSSGQKMYEYSHLELLIAIKKLLIDQKMTIEKAKREFAKRRFTDEQIDSSSEGFEETIQTPKGNFPSKAMAKRSPQGKHLSSDNLSKLLAAKSKLDRLMKLTKNVQERYSWD
jgi:DNA-binding transcriptional MerR regulator